MRLTPQPVSRVGPEKAKPGSDGATTWNASAGSPPCERGSVSGPRMFRKSNTVLGHPWVMISGVASGSGERACRKWMVWPSTLVVNWGTSLRRASYVRQS